MNSNKEIIGNKNETIQGLIRQKDKIYLNLYDHNTIFNVTKLFRIKYKIIKKANFYYI